jgi:hypothetical protein
MHNRNVPEIESRSLEDMMVCCQLRAVLVRIWLLEQPSISAVAI